MGTSKFAYYLTPILKIWLFMFFLMLGSFPFAFLYEQVPGLPALFGNSLVFDIITETSLVLIVLGALLMMFKVQNGIDFYLVFIRKIEALPQFLKGTMLGAFLILIVAGVLYLNGNVVFFEHSFNLVNIALYLIYFLLIAIFEEFLFRTYPLYALAERYPLWFAIFLNGLLFSVAHFANPNITYLGAFNIFLAGAFFAIYTLQTNNIAGVVGLHFGWNFAQSVLLGYNVSGNNTIIGFVKANPVGVEYLSGGKFGIEGSVFCTLILAICVIWCVYKNGLGHIEFYEEEIDTTTQLED